MTAVAEPSADRLDYQGEPVTLANGQQVRLRYGMRSLMRLEEEHGGLNALLASVRGEGGKPITAIVSMLAAGLLHEHVTVGTGLVTAGAPLSRPDVLADLLDLARMQEYADAATRAITLAFPAAAPSAGRGNAGERTPGSRGESGSTPPR